MSARCTRCKGQVSLRTPPEGITQRIHLTKTTVSWRLRFSRFHWQWLPEDPRDRVRESYTTLDLCDWCAGDLFLFAQGLPPRIRDASQTSTQVDDLPHEKHSRTSAQQRPDGEQ